MKTQKHKTVCFMGLVLSVGLAYGSAEFDSMSWYEGRPDGSLQSDGEVLTWTPEPDSTMYVYLGEHSLEQVGDQVTVAWFWKSSGDELGCDCHDNISGGGECNFDDDVTCLAGTGDFRLGFFDSNGQGIMTDDGFETCLENPAFRGYLGYHWRFHPHICDAERFWEYKLDGSRESHTNLSLWKRTDPFLNDACGANLIGDCGGVCGRPRDPRPNARILDPQPACFSAPLGEWVPMSLTIEKVAEGQLKNTFSFNGVTFNYTDTESAHQPGKIDVFAIHMSNARPYDYVMLSTDVPQPLTADFNDDCIVDKDDWLELTEGWLQRGDSILPPSSSDDLLLRYQFNESDGSTAADSSGRNMDGDISGPANWNPQGYEGNCLQFDDDTVVNPPTTALSTLGDAVIFSCWLKGGDASGRDNWVFDIGNDPYVNARVPDALGNVIWHAAGDTLTWEDATPADWRDSWVHYAFVKDARAGRMAIYRNSEKVAERTGATASLAGVRDTVFDIGAKRSHANDYIGDIDDFRVYNTTLDDPGPDPDELLLWYKFNESQGATAADSSGQDMDGDISDSDKWCTDGWQGNCLLFEGDARVDVPPTALSNLGNAVTLTCWVRGLEDMTSNKDMWLFDVGDNPYMNARVPDDSGDVVWHAAGDTLTWQDAAPSDWQGSWAHYAFVKDAGTGIMAVYRNGEKVAERTGATASLAGVRNTDFHIGAKRSHNDDYEGAVDEFRVYNYALTESEIDSLVQKMAFSTIDLVRDGRIDLQDYLVLASQWLEKCLAPIDDLPARGL